MTMPQTGAKMAAAIMLKTVGSMASADKWMAGIVWVRTRAYDLVHDLLFCDTRVSVSAFLPSSLATRYGRLIE